MENRRDDIDISIQLEDSIYRQERIVDDLDKEVQALIQIVTKLTFLVKKLDKEQLYFLDIKSIEYYLDEIER